jgi:pantoate--beta-alanine ligase
MIVATTVADLRAHIAAFRNAGETVALVPTMGALHEGHLDLVRLAGRHARRVVVSIFVNPKQFAPHEDFDRYPRQVEADAAKLATVAADLIWAPTPTAMYRSGFATRIEIGGAAQGLETDFRPHFFGGVATVCCKLFNQVTPDVAIFGEKDYQQLAVLRQLVADLDLPLKIIGAPTRREDDGLALSSRNAYLTTAERQIAPALQRALLSCAQAIRAGTSPEIATASAAAAVLAAGFAKVDYIACRDAETLAAVATGADRPLRLLAAAWLGKTRLIDNIAV